MSEPFVGGCLCGAIRFELASLLPNVAHCHCSMCRKFHGAAFATIAGVRAQDFRFTSGEDVLSSYEAHNGTVRRFCSRCGSSLTFSSPKAPADVVEIALGTVDGEVNIEPDAHIFVDSGVAWAQRVDELPRHREGRTSSLIASDA